MDELVEMVQSKTGLSEDKAKQAVNLVVDFLKKKLPAPMASQVDAVLKNESLMDQAGGLLDKGKQGLGGVLGKK